MASLFLLSLIVHHFTGSPQSRDGDDELKADIAAIEKKLGV